MWGFAQEVKKVKCRGRRRVFSFNCAQCFKHCYIFTVRCPWCQNLLCLDELGKG